MSTLDRGLVVNETLSASNVRSSLAQNCKWVKYNANMKKFGDVLVTIKTIFLNKLPYLFE